MRFFVESGVPAALACSGIKCISSAWMLDVSQAKPRQWIWAFKWQVCFMCFERSLFALRLLVGTSSVLFRPSSLPFKILVRPFAAPSLSLVSALRYQCHSFIRLQTNILQHTCLMFACPFVLHLSVSCWQLFGPFSAPCLFLVRPPLVPCPSLSDPLSFLFVWHFYTSLSVPFPSFVGPFLIPRQSLFGPLSFPFRSFFGPLWDPFRSLVFSFSVPFRFLVFSFSVLYPSMVGPFSVPCQSLFGFLSFPFRTLVGPFSIPCRTFFGPWVSPFSGAFIARVEFCDHL